MACDCETPASPFWPAAREFQALLQAQTDPSAYCGETPSPAYESTPSLADLELKQRIAAALALLSLQDAPSQDAF